MKKKRNYSVSSTSKVRSHGRGGENLKVVYYETRTREINKRLTYECRCDEILKPEDEGSTCIGGLLFIINRESES